MNGYWFFVGTPIPVGDTNDCGMTELDLKKWKSHFEERDLIIADKIFRPIIRSLDEVSELKRVKNQSPNCKKEENVRQIILKRGN